MKRFRVVVALSCVATSVSISVAGAQSFPRPTTVASNLDFPAGLAFVDDSTMLVTERSGSIRVIEDGELRAEPLARIPTVISGETGLLGIAVSLDGANAYAFATDPSGDTNNIWRIPLGGGSAPEKIIDDLPAATYHNGGGVAFDRDGMLLVSNGEQHSQERAQDPNELGGKVYRYTPEGDIPDDNPYEGSPTLAFGLRNPYGVTVDPVSGLAWVTENGAQSFDEVNRIVRNGNYGWPLIEGPGSGNDLPGDYQDPVLAYRDIIVPTGLAFAGAGALSSVEGDLFFGTYGEASIHRVRLDPERRQALSDEVIHSGEQVIGMAWGPRGLYFTTPDSVRVIELAADAASDPGSPTPVGTPTPDPSPHTSPDVSPASTDDELDPIWIVAIVLAIVVGLGGGVFLARRRGRSDAL